MAPARLLVIAPSRELRDSLAFALEAEGFDVTATDRVPPESGADRFDCTVVEQKALAGPAPEIVAFCLRAHPVVLLATRPPDWLIDRVARFVETPDKNGALLAAVRNVLGADQAANAGVR